MNGIDERWKAIFSAVGIIIVNAAALFGIEIADGAQMQDILLGFAWLASLAWAIWKNHNFTPEAVQAQRYLDMLKLEKRGEHASK